MGGTAQVGRAMKARFLDKIPALSKLKNRARVAANQGYLKGFDGRLLPIKEEHYALSAYLQGGESIIMKKALVMLTDRAKAIDYKLVAFVHDEWQFEVHPNQAEELGQLAVQCIIDAGVYFNLRCPLDGEYKVGSNWAETH